MSHSISRRHFLRLSGLSITAVLAGCGKPQITGHSEIEAPATVPSLPSPTATALPTASVANPTTFREAPMLTSLVEAGKLPPLADRLPPAPLVISPYENVGRYGSTLRTAMIQTDPTAFIRLGRYEGLARWDPDWTQPIPNLAESWEFNADATEYVVVLRKGIRWSDGTPFTAEDIVFPFEHVYDHPKGDGVTEGLDWLFSKQPTITALDDLTIRFRFPVSHGQFLLWLAAPQGCINLVECPAAYAKRWHPDFTEGIDQQMHAEGFTSWPEFYRAKTRIFQNIRPWERPGIPTLGPWIAVNDMRIDNPWRLERNPYYWKVDSEGNQLPYIDYVTYDKVDNNAELLERAVEGSWDMIDRGLSDSVAFKERIIAEAAGKYETYSLIQSQMNSTVVAWNLNSPKPALRAFFNTRKVRQALSVAVDRQTIINEVFNGQGQPGQPAPRPESPFYDEEMMLQYTQYFPEQADAWLDEAGYARGADGRRYYPDGQPIEIEIEVFTSFNEQVAPYLSRDWEARGISTRITVFKDRSEWENVGAATQFDLRLWPGDGGLYDAIMSPTWYVPGAVSSRHMMAWARWYNNGRKVKEGAEEPPADIKKLLDLWDELTQAVDQDRQHALMRQILQLSKEGFYSMGIVLPADTLGIRTSRLSNMPDRIFSSWIYPTPGPTNPEQYYLTE